METDSITNESNWEILLSAFPSGWKELGKESGAIKHKLKQFNESDLLRILLIHIGKGYSLRETSVIAKLSGLAEISDVAILKRLRKSENWLLSLCQRLLAENGINTPQHKDSIKIQIVDGSIIKEPGKTGSQWRLHFSFTIPDFYCSHFEICSSKGQGTGETFSRYPFEENDYIIGDRGYSKANGIEYISSRKAYVLVRVNTASLPLYNKDHSSFNLLTSVKTLKEPLKAKEWDVHIEDSKKKLIKGRICALRKSEEQIEESYKKLKAQASRKQRKLKPETIEYAKYVIVFTTYPKHKFSKEEILEWYRLRWQIELIFKRMKSLLDMGHLPKFDPCSSRAWLYGKLFLALLTEKLARIARTFSPMDMKCRSRWREFEFIWHQIEQAIVPAIPLDLVLETWPEIARSLAEPPRTRIPMIDTFDF